MRSSFVFLGLLALTSAVLIAEESHKQNFLSFMRTHDKVYASHEFNSRFNTFKNFAQRVQDHNERFDKGEVTYTMKVDHTADYTKEEWDRQFTTKLSKPINNQTHPIVKAMVGAPDWIDWSTRGAVGPVKNQGHCGSCWAFAAAATLEGCHMMAGKGYTSLSEQQLQDCMFSRVCSPGGGGPDQAIDWAHNNNGIASSGAYPWTESDGNCHNADVGATTQGRLSAFGHTDIVNLVAGGPSAIGINADFGGPLQGYHGGVINGDCSQATNHAVLAVGYAQNCQGSGMDCWILKNSWGEGWGTKGYALIRKGVNQCGIEHDAHRAYNC